MWCTYKKRSRCLVGHITLWKVSDTEILEEDAATLLTVLHHSLLDILHLLVVLDLVGDALVDEEEIHADGGRSPTHTVSGVQDEGLTHSTFLCMCGWVSVCVGEYVSGRVCVCVCTMQKGPQSSLPPMPSGRVYIRVQTLYKQQSLQLHNQLLGEQHIILFPMRTYEDETKHYVSPKSQTFVHRKGRPIKEL